MPRSIRLLLACALVLATASGGSALARSARRAGGRPPAASLADVTPSPRGTGELVIAFTDHSRTVRFARRRRTVPRTLVTVIRYPTADAGAVDARGAPPDRSGGPYPLVVFAHGFDATPARYAALLRAWTEAGYVVAAPIFPLTNARTPGGPRESDLVAQPADMRFVISSLLALDATGHGVLGGLLDPAHIAVAGQSDGGSTALATAEDHLTADHRVGAAVILSGAEIPGLGGYTFAPPEPPLLAVQGTADTSNAPRSTRAYFRLAPPPKYLLWLWGAGHLGPYTDEEPQLDIVEWVTTAFLDRYLKLDPGGVDRMYAAGDTPGLADLTTHAR